MAANQGLNMSRPFLEGAPNDCMINPLRCMMKKLPCEIAVRFFGLGHHEQAGCILIETMHNAGPIGVTARMDFLKLANMMKQSVHQRSATGAMRGMHHHSRRLIDDNDRVVLEH